MIKITIYIKTEYDQELGQEEYDRLLAERNKYIDKGFSLEQAKHFNRSNESLMNKLENGSLDCVYVDVYANVLMKCGHTEKVYDGIGGCFVTNRKDVEDIITYYNMIENVKEQIEKELGKDIEYEIKWMDD